MLKKWGNAFIMLLIIVLGLIFNLKNISEFPSHIHAWAQSDRYALSLGFIDNNFNFFKPQTYIKNHQFPGDWKIPSKESITAVDFPIHEYVSALLMKLTGNHTPIIFRLYILLYSFFGLFFLFKLSELITENYLKSLFVVLFTATSPVFIYYQDGFLPSIPSLSNAIIGIYLYLKYLKTQNGSNFSLCILFLTLATLSRTTFIIPLVAILGVEFLRIVRKENTFKGKILPVSLSFLAIGGYYFYNKYLTLKYGSIYLNHFMPASSWAEALSIIKIVIEKWGKQYFSLIHWFSFAFLIIGIVIWKFKKPVNIDPIIKQGWFLLILLIIGNLLFSTLMLEQFQHHDYYFLDTFMFPMLIFLILLLSLLPKTGSPISKFIAGTLIIFVCLPLISNGIKTQRERRETGPWDTTAATINNFTESKQFLDSLKIDRNANILVLNPAAPNIPFILMDHKGYVIMSTKTERLKSAVKWDYDFLVFQNDYFVTDIYANFPEIINKIEKIADNGRITVCRKSDASTVNDLASFLKINNNIPLMSQSMTFNNEKQPNWSNIIPSSDYYLSPPSSGCITEGMEFGPTFKANSPLPLDKKNCLLFLSCSFLHSEMNDCEMIVAINSGKENLYYKSNNLKSLLKVKNQWEKIELIYQLPKVETDNYELGIYFYNTGKNKIFIDDLNFNIF
jgi:hypothetical protein